METLLAYGCMALFGVATAVVSVIRMRMKAAEAKRRIELLDSGKMCLACDSLEVEQSFDAVVCKTCGHRQSLQALKAKRVDANAVGAMGELQKNDVE